MTQQARMVARWWAVPPAGQVSCLVDVDPGLLRIGLDPLPDGAPAVIQFRPGDVAPLGDQVAMLLDEMDRVAVALFPTWLPGAERLEASRTLGVPAVREIAARVAARSNNFGPFLADLAERALIGPAACVASVRAPYPAEVRARGLARVIADAYGRDSAALLVELPEGLVPAEERALVGAAEWLAYHGQLTVWLAGARLRVVDRLPTVTISLPGYLTGLGSEAPPEGATVPGGTAVPPMSSVPEIDEPADARAVWYPPRSGMPRRDSPAEQRLEKALAPYRWADGRRWNYTYDWDLLGKPYRLDLFWPTERLVVEVDGPDHRERLKYADDRRRDVQLQLLGHAVLRFTNDEVLADVQAVVRKIELLLSHRRATEPPTRC